MKDGAVIKVDDLNLEIKDGELFALLGVNGAGKSTTIKMLSTLIRPTSGKIFIDNKDINDNLIINLKGIFILFIKY